MQIHQFQLDFNRFNWNQLNFPVGFGQDTLATGNTLPVSPFLYSLVSCHELYDFKYLKLYELKLIDVIELIIKN